MDTVTDRFGNGMSYRYTEFNYTGYVHPEYLHTPASYLAQISYDQYTVNFTYQELNPAVYRD